MLTQRYMLIADTETTGVDKSQDQILQFAALRIEIEP